MDSDRSGADTDLGWSNQPRDDESGHEGQRGGGTGFERGPEYVGRSASPHRSDAAWRGQPFMTGKTSPPSRAIAEGKLWRRSAAVPESKSRQQHRPPCYRSP
jgi:hypothetical protein